MIEARGLSKQFHDKKRGKISAVDDVSFNCQPGRIYGLLGANGAGKTTTLRMLATILEPTAGTALVCGHAIVEHPFYRDGAVSSSYRPGNGGIFWPTERAR